MNTSHLLALLDVGTPELMLILFAVLLLFGGQKLPELAKGLGKSMREFKKASAGIEEEIKRAMEDTPKPTPAVHAQPTLPYIEPAHIASLETPATPKVEPSAGPIP